MTQQIAIVNASHVLSDAQVVQALPALQTQIDRDFLPPWVAHLPDRGPFHLVLSRLGRIPKGAWPIYLNRHSTDEGDLGWHTDDGGMIMGRVFVADCMRFGVAWTADLSHEILETIADPDANRIANIDGKEYAYEVCDAVEADDVGYKINNVLVSNFVLPPYFSPRPLGSSEAYDYCGDLHGPCPALTPGGYLSVNDGSGWRDIQADKLDGMKSRRQMMTRWRSILRSHKRRQPGVALRRNQEDQGHSFSGPVLTDHGVLQPGAHHLQNPEYMGR